MSLEKRGDFREGESFADDGSGERARRAPERPFDVIVNRKFLNSEKLEKEARDKTIDSQESLSIEDLLKGIKDGKKE